jgi:hypothetical protein
MSSFPELNWYHKLPMELSRIELATNKTLILLGARQIAQGEATWHTLQPPVNHSQKKV